MRVRRHPRRAPDRRARVRPRHGPATDRGEEALLDYRRDVPALTLLADVRAESVRWLWPGRIPLGKPTVLDGDPGLGKSLISLDIAARVSTGRPMPDGSSRLHKPRGVVLLTCEDDLSDTVRPRLDAAGRRGAHRAPDPRRRRPPTLAHVDAIAEAIAATDAKLVVLDPFMAYMPLSVNSPRPSTSATPWVRWWTWPLGRGRPCSSFAT